MAFSRLFVAFTTPVATVATTGTILDKLTSLLLAVEMLGIAGTLAADLVACAMVGAVASS